MKIIEALDHQGGMIGADYDNDDYEDDGDDDNDNDENDTMITMMTMIMMVIVMMAMMMMTAPLGWDDRCGLSGSLAPSRLASCCRVSPRLGHHHLHQHHCQSCPIPIQSHLLPLVQPLS